MTQVRRALLISSEGRGRQSRTFVGAACEVTPKGDTIASCSSEKENIVKQKPELNFRGIVGLREEEEA